MGGCDDTVVYRSIAFWPFPAPGLDLLPNGSFGWMDRDLPLHSRGRSGSGSAGESVQSRVWASETENCGLSTLGGQNPSSVGVEERKSV